MMVMQRHARLMMFFVMSLVKVTSAWSTPQVPCFFIFGDSLVDNGNNNALLTLARANYMPYGIDFSEGSSGRFTNGRTMVDILSQLLGFRNYIPAYANARTPSEFLRGLNFASGAAGIREETGDNLGQHYSFTEQVENFGNAVRVIRRIFRGNTARVADHLSQCIFFSGMGSNDYLNNYFMPNLYSSSYEYSPKTFASILLEEYTRQLTNVYNLGARKVAVIGVGQIGCIPYELARYNTNDNNNGTQSHCNNKINKAIAIFNKGLVKMVNRFNDQFPGAKFIYVNTFESSKDLVENASSYGFEVIDKGCCGVGRNNGQITCLPLQQPCQDRRKYLFWDAFHPTEYANIIYAKKAYSSTSKSEVYPVNIRQLVMA
ncbi:LOW QUALITY PROTEIN: GDSL esterase/lipase At1g33811-like [Dioscorea cayenensis subsp. rotundata]|uniref:LOW QUALITY PROTEIN: GDSL esterase/lipase At1g33811-like n=1 Tax=Dioscorea cayennensis subsp. rotundata TaxID=55577 RepID=A0AB40ATT4_DIOCR|nr:LOW QUALITY PROTEIN: GDSL esterase/lipase At1g33811-like [Dioscorea cayenensis subsp. rotundata]